MGCYKCGSAEGSDSRLCPRCNSARRSERAAGRGGVPSALRPSAASSTARRRPNPGAVISMFLIGVGCFGALVYGLFLWPGGPMVGTSFEDKFVARCVAKIGDMPEFNAKGFKGKGPAAAMGLELARGLHEAMSKMPEEICKGMAKECERPDKKPMCARIMQSF